MDSSQEWTQMMETTPQDYLFSNVAISRNTATEVIPDENVPDRIF